MCWMWIDGWVWEVKDLNLNLKVVYHGKLEVLDVCHSKLKVLGVYHGKLEVLGVYYGKL